MNLILILSNISELHQDEVCVNSSSNSDESTHCCNVCPNVEEWVLYRFVWSNPIDSSLNIIASIRRLLPNDALGDGSSESNDVNYSPKPNSNSGYQQITMTHEDETNNSSTSPDSPHLQHRIVLQPNVQDGCITCGSYLNKKSTYFQSLGHESGLIGVFWLAAGHPDGIVAALGHITMLFGFKAILMPYSDLVAD